MDISKTFQVMRTPAANDPMSFPLGPDASAQEVMALMDGIALKVFPKGYWPVEWTMGSVNVIIFFTVTMAMRHYRSRGNAVPIWLFKLEKRPIPPFPFKLNSLYGKKSKATQDVGSGAPKTQLENGETLESAADHRYTGLPSRISRFLRLRKREKLDNAEKVHSSKVDGEEGETKLGTFITASCVNCHLVLTSAFVLMLFFKTLEAYVSREASAAPPLLDPSFLDVFMHAAIFSTAYFAAVGYIAILFPWVPPMMWNSAICQGWLAPVTAGILSISTISIRMSKVNSYRNSVFMALTLSPETSLGNGQFRLDAPVDTAVLSMAKNAYDIALSLRLWCRFAYGLVAVGGILLTFGYLGILVLLTKRVAKDLVEIRNTPSPTYADRRSVISKGEAVAMWPTTAVPSSMPNSPARSQARMHTTVQLRSARNSLSIRTGLVPPPPKPAPSGPLPALPKTPFSPTSRSSTPDNVTYEGCDGPAGRQALSPLASSLRFNENDNDSSEGHGDADRKSMRRQNIPQALSAPQSPSSFRGHSALVSRGDDDNRHTHEEENRNTDQESSSSHQSNLSLGPRTRINSDPAPWAPNSFHDDIASQDGYIAVCRFLCNCSIDHIAVMLQCLVFGGKSIYIFLAYQYDYPHNAAEASLKIGYVTMFSSTWFALLYLLNCLNLFAPFLLFPTSQVKLATMLANLSTSHSGLDSSENGDEKSRSSRKRSKSASRYQSPSSLARFRGDAKLRHKESVQNLLLNKSQANDETYMVTEKDADVNSVRSDKPLGSPTASGHPFSSFTSPTLFHKPSLKKLQWDSSVTESPTRESSEHRRGPMGTMAASIASVAKLFSPAAAPADNKGPIVNALQIDQNPHAAGAPAGDGVAHPATAVRPWSGVWKISSFSSSEKSVAAKSRSHHKNLFESQKQKGHSSPALSASSSLSDMNLNHATCESTMRKRPAAKQMVLDSLISSHALPIQGFYCQGSAPPTSFAAWRQAQSSVSLESGTSVSYHGETAHRRQRSTSDERRHQREESEGEEELRPFQQHPSSDSEDASGFERRRSSLSRETMSYTAHRQQHQMAMMGGTRRKTTRSSASLAPVREAELSERAGGSLNVPRIVVDTSTPSALARTMTRSQSSSDDGTCVGDTSG